MKKITLLLLAVGAIVFSTSLSYGQDVLLGTYNFTTGADQLKASGVADGITMGDIVIDPAKLTANYSSDAIEISNWATSMNISAGKCINIPLNKAASASEFNVSRVDIVLKRTTANKIQINFGNEANTFDSKTYTATTLHGTSSYATYALTEATGTGSVVIPAKTDANTLYLSIGTMSASNTEVVYIDKIEIYGTVNVITVPSIMSNITQKKVSASINHPLTFEVILNGANLTQATTVSLIGDGASYFSKDVSSIAAVDLNASSKTISVSYAANSITYNSLTRLQTPHTATLRIENPEITTIDVALSATCDLLFEDFSNYDATANSSNSLAVLPTIPDDVPLSLVSGWAGDQLYAYKAGSPNLGTACLGSTNADSAFLTTPTLDLSQPFDLFFKARSLVVDTDGKFKVFLDGNQLIYDSINTSISLRRYTTTTFVGTSSSKLTFTGRKVDLNEIIVDSIVVNYSSLPALNIPLNKVENFGTTVPGGQKTVDIAIKGYNLTGDLNLSLEGGTNFTLLTGATVAQATATAGTTVQVRFNAPLTTGTYTDKLIIGTSDFRSREISLTAISDNTTGMSITETGKVLVNASDIVLSGYAGANVIVYSVAGVKIAEQNNIADQATISVNNRGCFLLKIEKNGNTLSHKVMIH
ncbi:MAG: hypothetical protein VB066_07870 [Paludibacter sp.]|nr:hypothetical protein [Paludibacter sp.]